MKKVTIPSCTNPFVVAINGTKHIYPAGTEQEVPDGVALIIEQHYGGHEENCVGDAAYNVGYVAGKQEGYAAGVASVDTVAVARSILNGTITEYIDPDLTTIMDYAFYERYRLKTIDTPNVREIGISAFDCCENLGAVVFPRATEIWRGAFADCGRLVSADFSVLDCLDESAFRDSGLQTLILRSESTICWLCSTNAFSDTPISDENGYIYVPSALVDSYKTETNWSKLADCIRALEDYTVDGTTTGALDESKI